MDIIFAYIFAFFVILFIWFIISAYRYAKNKNENNSWGKKDKKL